MTPELAPPKFVTFVMLAAAVNVFILGRHENRAASVGISRVRFCGPPLAGRCFPSGPGFGQTPPLEVRGTGVPRTGA
jgi:hypothetical protein